MNEPSVRDKRALYDRYAETYEERTRDYTTFLEPDYQAFAAALPGTRVLDLGCGPGRDAAILKERGLDPLCLDLSTEMLRLCSEKGLATKQMNIEQLALDPESFDGVWSHTSLTTIPKRKAWTALHTVHSALVPGGVLFLGLIEGEGERWKPADAKYALPRFISRYQREEVEEQLAPLFAVEEFRRIDISETGRNSYLNFLLRKL